MIWKTGNRLIDNDSVVFYDMTAWQYLTITAMRQRQVKFCFTAQAIELLC